MSRWVIQKIATDEPSAVEVDWDTWQIGTVEDGMFLPVYSCFSAEDAQRVAAALEWYEGMEAGVMGAPAPVPEVKARRAKR